MHNVSRWGLRGRRALRRFLYAQMAMRSAVMIAIGKEHPLVRFTVEDDPPSVYLLFRINAGDVDGLPAAIGLPDGMRLAPIRVLADDDPEYVIVLNVYRVSGITNGLRAEWSVFIEDAEGVPRYLVIDARASNTSMDPVEVITKKSRVEHERVGDLVTMTIGEPGEDFAAEITIPADAPVAPGHAEFAAANDTIYWANGIYDRTFYDAGMHAADQLSVPDDLVTTRDQTRWARFVEPTPIRTLVFRDAIELVVSPWANIDDLH